MHCPKCKNFILKPQKLENGLLTFACDQCKGSLLPILQYLQWSQENTCDNDEKISIKPEDTKQALQCPKCNGIMTKYRISTECQNRLDICMRCYETWLDSGEWQLLKNLDFIGKLPDIFTEFWQKQIISKIDRQNQTKRYEAYFAENYQTIKDFKSWLDGYGKKPDVLNFLKNNSI